MKVKGVNVIMILQTDEAPVSGHPRAGSGKSVRNYWNWPLTGMCKYRFCMSSNGVLSRRP